MAGKYYFNHFWEETSECEKYSYFSSVFRENINWKLPRNRKDSKIKRIFKIIKWNLSRNFKNSKNLAQEITSRILRVYYIIEYF